MFRQRRSLGKGISQSRRVNKLSDQGALLYTWMIHSYDDEGRMTGDPEDLRYNIVPRRDITTDQVIEHLLEMNELELIRWYLVDGKPYIEMDPEAWTEHQTFKGIHRIASKIPTYDPKKHLRYVDRLRSQPSEVDETTLEDVSLHPKGCTTTPEGMEEVKLREVKSLSKDKQPSADQSSFREPLSRSTKHFSNKIESVYLEPLLDIAKKIQGKSNGKKAFNFYQWIQIQIKKKAHPGAMIKAGTALIEYWDTVENPRGYLDGIMKVENGNANERDWNQEHKQIEAEFHTWLASPAGQKITKQLNLKNMEA